MLEPGAKDSHKRGVLTMKDVLSPVEVKTALATLKAAAFVDGKASALGGWIRNRIADNAQRAMLCELEQIIAGMPSDTRRRGLINVYANLTKMWSV